MPTATPAPESPSPSASGPDPGDWAGAGYWPGALDRVRAAAARPVSAQSVAVFRIGFGLLVAAASIRFLARGWVDTLYLQPDHHLTYRWFGWVQPLPAPWMQVVVGTLGVLGVCIALGYRHRLAAAAFMVGFGYTELIEAALYLNHYWFVTLAAGLLVALPVHHHWSIDAARQRVPSHPKVAAGVVWALRAQLAVVYLFAGLAKLNSDWLFRAQPLRLWLADRTGVPLVGPVLDEPAVAFLASWWGAAFDCTIVGWLLWSRSRSYAYAALVAFHLSTGALFQIGVFPWVMMVGTLVFFQPDWPQALGARLRARPVAEPVDRPGSRPTTPRPVVAGLVTLAVAQIIIPLRHYAIDGNVRWTEEGYYLSWRVMLTEKAGHVTYEVTDPATGVRYQVGPDVVLTDWQAGVAATRPDLIQATAHLIAGHYADQGMAGVEVRADAWVTMNGRPSQRIVDPDLDLVAHPRGRLPEGWILSRDSDG